MGCRTIFPKGQVAPGTLPSNFYLFIYRPKLSSMVAYKHPSVLPVRENDVQNLHLYVGKFIPNHAHCHASF